MLALRRVSLSFVALWLSTVAGASGQTSTIQMPALPLPRGWQSESKPFPLDFAPTIPYEGSLEIRFMPDMFDPHAKSYFSYDYLWWVRSQPAFGAGALERDLTLYYQGLMTSVDAYHGRSTSAEATLVKATPIDRSHFVADVATRDAFNADIPLHLRAEVTVQNRGEYTAIFFAIAPATASQRIRDELAAVVANGTNQPIDAPADGGSP